MITESFLLMGLLIGPSPEFIPYVEVQNKQEMDQFNTKIKKIGDMPTDGKIQNSKSFFKFSEGPLIEYSVYRGYKMGKIISKKSKLFIANRAIKISCVPFEKIKKSRVKYLTDGNFYISGEYQKIESSLWNNFQPYCIEKFSE